MKLGTHLGRIILSAALLAAPLALAPRVSAQPSKAAAEALFQEGKRLMGEGDHAAACPKLAESHRLDPAPGTLMNLGDCYDRLGKTASAWSTWREAEARARSAGQTDREQHAAERARALEPRLVRLSITVPAASRTEGLEVKLDGASITEAMWAVPLPIDPGRHVIEAAAPGRQAWRHELEVQDGMGPTQVEIPTLVVPTVSLTTPTPAPTQAEAVVSNPAGEPAMDRSGGAPPARTAGFVLGGVGLVGLGVGAVFGSRAIAKNADSEDQCRTERLCSAEGKSLRDDAYQAAGVSTVGFVVGGLALGAGVLLIVSAPHRPRAAVTIGPRGVALGGRF